MALAREEIEELIKKAFPDAEIVINDLAGDNDHWSLYLSTQAFKGKSRIEQHKMVYQALEGNMGTLLHALQLKTCIPSHTS